MGVLPAWTRTAPDASTLAEFAMNAAICVVMASVEVTTAPLKAAPTASAAPAAAAAADVDVIVAISWALILRSPARDRILLLAFEM